MRTILAAIVLLVAAGCSSGPGDNARARGQAQEPVTVSLAKPERRTITDGLSLAGTITPYEQVTLYAKTSGYLKWIKVDIGDSVRKGDLLADIEVPEMLTTVEEKRAAVVKAEATVEQARAAVEQSRADLEFQEISYQRLKAIHDRDTDVLPEQEVDQARSGYGVARGKLKTSEAQVKVAEAGLATARAELATVTAILQYARIIAPMTGVITERFVDPGALIQAASSSRTQAAPLVSIARLDQLRVLVDVPEPKVRAVRPGTGVRVEVPAYAGESFAARVTRVGAVLDPGSRTMRVEIDLPNPTHSLRPGMTARVELELERFEGALTVPVSAVRFQGRDRAVFVVEAGKAKQRAVKTGLEAPQWIQILGGLGAEEEIVTAAAGPLADGAPVRVNR